MSEGGVLQKVAARLGRQNCSMAEYEQRFSRHNAAAEPPVYPAMESGPAEFFKLQAAQNLFEISRVADLQTAVAGLSTPLPLALSPQQRIRSLPWEAEGFTLTDNLTVPAIGIIEASHGIAETGSVAIGSREVPSALLFLAEEMLIVLDSANILGCQEELWDIIGHGHQRALHLISGPSRTADVEQTLQVGAHGPRRVYLWLLE